jgi:hypothetical protein
MPLRKRKFMADVPDKCPECGSDLIACYGLFGGGIGGYWICDGDTCLWYAKEVDEESTKGALK